MKIFSRVSPDNLPHAGELVWYLLKERPSDDLAGRITQVGTSNLDRYRRGGQKGHVCKRSRRRYCPKILLHSSLPSWWSSS